MIVNTKMVFPTNGSRFFFLYDHLFPLKSLLNHASSSPPEGDGVMAFMHFNPTTKT